MQDSKLLAERTKGWQQLVSKVNEAYSTTNGILSSVNSVDEAKIAVSSKGVRNS